MATLFCVAAASWPSLALGSVEAAPGYLDEAPAPAQRASTSLDVDAPVVRPLDELAEGEGSEDHDLVVNDLPCVLSNLISPYTEQLGSARDAALIFSSERRPFSGRSPPRHIVVE